MGMEIGETANRVKCPFNIHIIERRSRESVAFARCFMRSTERSGTSWKLHNKEAAEAVSAGKCERDGKMPLPAELGLGSWVAGLTRNKFPGRNIMYSVAVADSFLIQFGRPFPLLLSPTQPDKFNPLNLKGQKRA